MLIKKKLPLMMIILVSVPLIILSFLIYNYTSKSLIYSSKSGIIQIVNTETDTLTALINEQKREVELSVQKANVVELLKSRLRDDKESFLNSPNVLMEDSDLYKRVKKLPELQHSFIADMNGTIISDSKSSIKGLSVLDRKYFAKVMEGNVVISETLVSKADDKLIIVVAAPVRDGAGKIIGLFGNAIYTEYFQKFTSKIEIGKTGYAYIVDNEGLLVTHPDKKRIGTRVENSIVSSIVNKNKDSASISSGTDFYTYNNTEKFISYNTVENAKWILAVVQNTEEINAPARFELYMILGIMIIMILASIRFSIIAARTITHPIGKLIETMDKAADGDLDSKCEHNTKDELGQLAYNFNIMIQKVSSNYEEISALYEELTATEEELRAQYDTLVENEVALSLSEERYKQALDGINDAVWEWNIDTNEFFVSDKWYDITGYKTKNIDIKKVLKTAVLPEFQTLVMKDIREHIDSKTEGYRSEFKIVTLNGEIKWVLNRGKLIRNADGKPCKLTGAITDITASKSIEEKIKQLAYYDGLTGLPNRTSFIKELYEEIDMCKKCGSRKGAVLFIDLDDFKKVNDSLGHDMGDKLLKVVSQKFSSLVNKEDIVCRFGGDEFLILRKNIKNTEEVETLSNELIKIFENYIDIEEKQIFITSSIGICMFPSNGTDKNSILKNADTAMYKAKEKGKNRFQFYNEEMSTGLVKNIAIERAVRNGLVNDELYLNYQPQVDIKTGKIIGAEALIRLENKELGFISPEEFIPIAEKSGLIIPVGDWVMERAYNESQMWTKKGYDLKRIAVNVSSMQIHEINFVDKIKAYIKKSGIPPRMVEIEITESMLMESIESNVEILNELRNYGVRISLDDFGTGYSSLNYLRIIPIDTLKIDKSFIDDICSNSTQGAIVDSIIQMAHKMGIEVVAEGVETKEQLEVLKEKQCDIVQGYVFSRPLSEEDMEELLKKNLIQ